MWITFNTSVWVGRERKISFSWSQFPFPHPESSDAAPPFKVLFVTRHWAFRFPTYHFLWNVWGFNLAFPSTGNILSSLSSLANSWMFLRSQRRDHPALCAVFSNLPAWDRGTPMPSHGKVSSLLHCDHLSAQKNTENKVPNHWNYFISL